MRSAGALAAAVLLAGGCRLVDAASDSDQGPRADAAPCPTVSLVSDDFEDSAVDPAWFPYGDPGAATEEADGVLRVEYSGVEPAWAGYATVDSFDLRGGALRAEIAQVGGDTILELNAGDTKVQTYGYDSTLFGVVVVAGDTTSEFETDYLPAAHRHWRMREQDGRIHWETSPDGDDWSEIDARPTPLDATAVTLLVSGGGVDGDAAAEFESVTIEAPDADCSAASL